MRLYRVVDVNLQGVNEDINPEEGVMSGTIHFFSHLRPCLSACDRVSHVIVFVL